MENKRKITPITIKNLAVKDYDRFCKVLYETYPEKVFQLYIDRNTFVEACLQLFWIQLPLTDQNIIQRLIIISNDRRA